MTFRGQWEWGGGSVWTLYCETHCTISLHRMGSVAGVALRSQALNRRPSGSPSWRLITTAFLHRRAKVLRLLNSS